MSSEYIISTSVLSKSFTEENIDLKILNNINISIKPGEFIAIVGPSGSGKSTLMNNIGLLDKPSSGKLNILGFTIDSKTNINRLAKLRRINIGFVFQTFNLLPRISAVQNVELPMIYAGASGRHDKAKELLEDVGLSHRLNHRPNQLSGGERQRVAIARALANDPQIILADEPTGNLDSKSGHEIIQLLKKLNKSGKTVIVVTHDPEIASSADRTINIKDGKLT